MEAQESNKTKFITVNELMDILHIGNTLAYKLVNLDGFPSVKIGKKILIDENEMYLFMKQYVGSQINV